MVEAYNPTAYEGNPKILRKRKAKFRCFINCFPISTTSQMILYLSHSLRHVSASNYVHHQVALQ